MAEALSPEGIPKMYGDVPPFMGVRHVPDPSRLDGGVAVVGMPYDGIATFRGGATRRAPQEIRKYSLLFGGYHFDWDMDLFKHLTVADIGDVDVVPGDNAESYRRFGERLTAVLRAGAVPLSLGGDHGITYPAVRAVADNGDEPLGLIVFDTHLDLSEAFNGDRLTRASPILRICELNGVDPKRIAIIGARGPRNLPEWTPTYKELGIHVFPIDQVAREGIEAVTEKAARVARADGSRVYISVDIDGVDPAYAPGTNSPEPGGLTSREIISGVRCAARDGFAGFDIVEVSPDFDNVSGNTSTLAARLGVEALCSLAAFRSGHRDAWRTDIPKQR